MDAGLQNTYINTMKFKKLPHNIESNYETVKSYMKSCTTVLHFFLQWQSYFTVLHMNAADELTVFILFFKLKIYNYAIC